MTSPDIATRVANERAAQGLGPTVTDPTTLRQIATVLALAREAPTDGLS